MITQMLVVGTQHEFGEERNLITVFAFGFHLIGKCGAEVLQPLAILPAVEQHLIHHDKELASPVGIELAAEILVGVESHIVLKKGFQKFRKVLLPVLRSSDTNSRIATSELVAGRAVADSPSPTRTVPRRCAVPKIGYAINRPPAVGGLSVRRG